MYNHSGEVSLSFLASSNPGDISSEEDSCVCHPNLQMASSVDARKATSLENELRQATQQLQVNQQVVLHLNMQLFSVLIIVTCHYPAVPSSSGVAQTEF